jgi:3-methyladenine DNA glycosylase AlkC
VAEALKDKFSSALVEKLAAEIASVYPAFKAKEFASEIIRQLKPLALMDRARLVANVLEKYLPSNFKKSADILVRSLVTELEAEKGFGFEVFRYLPYIFWIIRNGLDDFETSMNFQKEVTKRFTAEFSLRYFIEKYPEASRKKMLEWTLSPNVHVRRLVSEGTRPRLPWAPRLKLYQAEPHRALEFLELLKDDPTLYVRKSVANHLGDIAKDHPKFAVEIGKRWYDEAKPHRVWIVRHGLRALIKKGFLPALKIFGVHRAPEVKIEKIKLDKLRVTVGQTSAIHFSIRSLSKSSQTLLVDYAVAYIKSNGSAKPKVFKLTKLDLKAKESDEGKITLKWKPLTTRSYYSGIHRVELRINGVSYPLTAIHFKA